MNSASDAYGLRLVRRPELVPDFVRAIPPNPGGEIVAYDADGTLWTDDVADDFTQWMITEGNIPGDDWARYLRIYRDDAPAACRFLLSLYTGLSMARLHELVEHWWLQHARRTWVWSVIESLHHLADKGYEIWVVTGSPTDVMIPLLHMLPVARIVGMDYELDDGGVITGRLSGISCAGTGKADKIAHLASDRVLRLCVGNGSLDGPMMAAAEQAWSVYPNPDFEKYSREMGWPVLVRPADFVEEAKFVVSGDDD